MERTRREDCLSPLSPGTARFGVGGGMVTKLLGSEAPASVRAYEGVVLRPAGLFCARLCLGSSLEPCSCPECTGRGTSVSQY